MKYTARGLKDPKDYGDTSNLTVGDIVPYVRQKHIARRAGTHQDVRLGRDKMFSWATRKELPQPGERTALYPSGLHDQSYMNFQGRLGKGYGAGEVRTIEKGEVQILQATPSHIRFATAHTGEPEIFDMVRITGRDNKPFWLTTNKTPTETVPGEKMHYTKIPAEKIDKLMDPDYVMSSKIDGAASFLRLMKNHVDVLSYRTGKNKKPIIHTQRMQLPDKMDIPKEFQGRMYRGEIYGEKGGRTIPAAQLGGLLNSTLANSIRRQQNDKIKLKMALFGASDPNSPESWSARPKEQVRAEILAALQHLPKDIFTEPPYAYTPEEKLKMWEGIKGGQDPLTREGVIGFPAKGGVPAKVVMNPPYDVVIRNIFPAQTKSSPRAGGFGYSLLGKSEVVGKVGSGASHEVLKDMLANPDKYVGRTAVVHAKEQFPSGALRAPSFHSLQEDINKQGSENMLKEYLTKNASAITLPMKINGLMRQGLSYDEAVKELSRVSKLVRASNTQAAKAAEAEKASITKAMETYNKVPTKSLAPLPKQPSLF